MNRSPFSVTVVAILGLALGACSSGGGGGGGGGQAAPAPGPRPITAMPSNTICPVMGRPVDPSIPTSVYEGRVIGFCCDACKPRFDANPAAYAGNIR